MPHMQVQCGNGNSYIVMGHGVEVAHDDSYAVLKIRSTPGSLVTLIGTPKELRKLARSITEMLRKPRKENNHGR